MTAGARRPSVHVDIAGHVFRVVGAPAPARSWMSERYGPFLTDKAPAMTLDVRCRGEWGRGRAPRPRVSLRGAEFSITMANCRAEGSLKTRRARITVPPIPAALSPGLFRALASLLLAREGGFLVHASAVVDRGRAWVFCGPSESGKTTIARLAAGRVVLNDETVAIVSRADGYAACATPFFGEGGPLMAQVNVGAPLRAMLFLNQAREFAHRRLAPRDAVARAWQQVFLPKRDGRVADAMLEALVEFARRVPCFDLFFPPRPELWEYLDGLD